MFHPNLLSFHDGRIHRLIFYAFIIGTILLNSISSIETFRSDSYSYSISNQTLSNQLSNSFIGGRCMPNSCENDGKCLYNDLGQPYCRCAAKYAGRHCQYLNPCYGSNRCFNGGTCQTVSPPNQTPTIKCLCPLGFSATLCEVEDANVCRDTRPCANGGKCVLKGNLTTYECICALGWRGPNCQQPDNCATQPCRNGATCHSTSNGYQCHCAPGFTGTTCSDDVNECHEIGHQRACNHKGVCINTFGSYRCNCEPDFTGQHCETRYVPCETNPCENGGNCVPNYQSLSYNCTCKAGFIGHNCEVNIDDCGGHLCQNGGTCIDGVNKYTCSCPANFTGPFCAQDVDECSIRPHVCQNGATCANTHGSFSCICVNGWTGATCSENINDCVDIPCFNGATCHDRVGSFYCQCPPGKTGLLCHLEDACASNPCQAGAVCDTSPVDGTYICSCPSGFKGIDCTEDIDECHDSGSPCEHGGTCVNIPGSFRCDCAVGFAGARCEVNINECDSNPCQNDGTCLDERGSYRCVCMPGYTGIHCETNIDECQSNPCQNNALCTDLINGYRCLCMHSFEGSNCEKLVDQCYNNPCRNGGTCHNEFQTYGCACPDGFTGRNCEINVNDCESNPCLNNGKCIDMINSFQCVCKAGYTGLMCQNQINECLSMPCLYGGTCIDIPGAGYRCRCPNGTEGYNCGINENECWSNPCYNGGTCHDQIGRYKCQCPAGFRGDQCEIDIDECQSNPCANGATCYNMPNAFKCVCPKGFFGSRCLSDVDECASNPCFNGGTCEDDVNKYVCHCVRGYTGRRCEANIDECASNPCLNGGLCYDHIGNFTCKCQPGFMGSLCEVNINECAPNPCLNNGRCIDMINGFRCSCTSGFTGNYCENDVDECATNPCANGAVCEDRPNGFHCTCMNGFYGPTCQSTVNEWENDSSSTNENGDHRIRLHKNPWKNCPKAEYCYKRFRNGRCDPECNIRECFFDDFECNNFNNNNNNHNINHPGRPIGTCNEQFDSYCSNNYGNGFCDYGCNNAECGWDGLDCEKDPPGTNEDLNGDLLVDIDMPITQLNNSGNEPPKLKLFLRALFAATGSVFRVKEIRSDGYGSSLVINVDNRKCSDQCFENPQQIADFLRASKERGHSELDSMMEEWGASYNAKASEKGRIGPENSVQSFTYAVLILFSLLFIGILLGVLYSTSGRKKVARGITWFPEGFFAHQIIPGSGGSSRSGHHHRSSEVASAAGGQFNSRHGRRNNERGIHHSNSIRSGCPDGQEMLQFKSREDLLLNDDKANCAAIYEEPYENRHWTNAHYDAFQQPHDSMTPPLPANHSSIDVPGPNGMTPLMTMVSTMANSHSQQQQQQQYPLNDNPELVPDNKIVLDLLNNGANPNLTCDKTAETSLHLAARYARADAAKRLIEGGADCNAQDATGRTPLHTAIAADARGVFEILLRNRTANLNSRTNDGTTPLILSARMANEGMVEQLVTHECDLNGADDSGKTALHWAASVNNLDAVRVLLQHGADRDAKNNKEETPLFLAAREGAYACAKLLLDFHANRDITDHMDRLPRDVALERMHTDIVTLLDEYEPQSPQLHSQLSSGSSSNNVLSPQSSSSSNWNGTLGRTGTGATAAANTTLSRRRTNAANTNTMTSSSNNNNNGSNTNTMHHHLHHQQHLQQQHHQHQSSILSTTSTELTTASIQSTGTLKKHQQQQHSAQQPPPPPPPRNGVSLYSTCAMAAQQLSPHQAQPMLLLGSGAPDNGEMIGTTTAAQSLRWPLANLNMTNNNNNGIVGGNCSTMYTSHQQQRPIDSYPTPSPDSWGSSLTSTSSAMISPPSRPPPPYEDCFTQQQSIAVAPRHVMTNSQPATPTATTAPNLNNNYGVQNGGVPGGAAIVSSATAAQSLRWPLANLNTTNGNNGGGNGNCTTMFTSHQQQRPTDSYPTPSPDSWGSLSTSSPLSAHEWNASNTIDGMTNMSAGTTNLNQTNGNTMMMMLPGQTMSPTGGGGAAAAGVTNPRFQPSSTQQAVFI